MRKQIEFKKGYLLIEVHKPKIKWVNKRLLAYVVKCAEQGRFDLLGMTVEEVEEIIKNTENKRR